MSRAEDDGYVASIDLGTTSLRVILFTATGTIAASSQSDYPQHYPEPGWHEHTPSDWLEALQACIKGAFEKLPSAKGKVKAVGVTTQRETTCVWNRNTGKELCNAIVWTDQRTVAIANDARRRADAVSWKLADGSTEKGEAGVRQLTGLPFSSYFSATKAAWITSHLPEVKKAIHDGTALIGTPESFLLWHLLDGHPHLTDVTNASRTLLFDLHALDWNSQLLEFWDIPRKALPDVRSNSEEYGTIKGWGELDGCKITGVVGDQQGALIGNRCLGKGEGKQTYGTGCFMLYNTGPVPVHSSHGLLTTVAYQPASDAKPTYALEGSIAVGGSSVQWLRDNLGLISRSETVSVLASEVEDSAGVLFVPAFSGLFAPYWDTTARGTIVGLTSHTTKHHICRATLEATAFQTRAIWEAMKLDSEEAGEERGGGSLTVKDGDAARRPLKVDGGMTKSNLLLQIQADVLGFDIERPEMAESTALGAALLAGAFVSYASWDLKNPSSFKPLETNVGKTTFKPEVSAEVRAKRWKAWERAVERARGWISEEEDEHAKSKE